MNLAPDTLHGDWIDVSRPLSNATPVWPEDRAFRMSRADVPGFVVGSFETTCHVGTHVDAPLHLDPRATAVDGIALQRFLGAAEVVRTPRECRLVGREHLGPGWVPSAPRVLFRTDSHPLNSAIGAGFSALSEALIGELAEHGVQLIGIDTPSVDPFDSADVPCHRAMAALGMTWIEGLWLEQAEPGLYLMIGLPMALAEADAAPVRVILRRA